MATPIRVVENTKRGGGASSTRSANGTRKAKRTFIVEYAADDPPASLAEVETADDGTTAIPATDSALPGDTSRFATDVSVKPRDGTGLLFDVEVDYETADNEIGDNPLTVPVDYDWDFSASSQAYFLDTAPGPNGPYAVRSSAGEPFDNLLEREVGEIVVTVTDNIAAVAWDPVLAAQYMAGPATAVNNASMTIDGIAIAAGQARFAGIKCSGIKTSNAIDYRTRVIVLKLRDSWDHEVDDRGRFQLDPDDTSKLLRITDAENADVEKPYPLDGDGFKKTNPTDAPATLVFKPYPPRDFVPWGIT